MILNQEFNPQHQIEILENQKEIFSKHLDPNFWEKYLFMHHTTLSVLKYLYDGNPKKSVRMNNIIQSKKIECEERRKRQILKKLMVDRLILSKNGAFATVKNKSLIKMIQRTIIHSEHLERKDGITNTKKQKQLLYFLPKIIDYDHNSFRTILKEAREKIGENLAEKTVREVLNYLCDEEVIEKISAEKKGKTARIHYRRK